MAFRQPTAAPQRQPLAVDRSSQTSRQHVSPLNQPIDDTQEWVLFSPTRAQTESILSTERTPRTAGLSRLSDFGSWTVARSGQEEETGLPDVVEDADELDSLDDGLHAFREPNTTNTLGRFDQSGGSILPAHDGLGGFPASSPPVQEQLYNFELYNTQRKHAYGHHRTTSSVQRRLDSLEDESEDSAYLDKARRERIEQWRMDSSRIMMEEIQKERRSKGTRPHTEEDSRLRSVSRSNINAEKRDAGRASRNENDPEDSETLWQRITRRVIKDLMGIDDNILSVILGESLADEDELSKTPTPESTFPAAMESQEHGKASESWEDRLIRRLAKELGMLAQYLSGSASLSSSTAPSATMDYAGIPVRTESTKSYTQNDDSAQFFPTIKNRDIPKSTSRRDSRDADQQATATHIAEIEYWERTPDLKTVFSYLSQHFISNRYANSHTTSSNIATTHTEDSLNRAAIIRQHHPLVSRSRHALTNERRGRRSSIRLSSQLGGVSGRNSAMSQSLKRAGTSCASWSTKRHKVNGSDGGSRNYWDIGGSLGSENAALGGVWGEV